MYAFRDNIEDNDRQIMTNYPSLQVSLCLLYFLCSHAVSLQIASLVQSRLRTMTAGEDSQTTPVQIMYVFAMCCYTCPICVEQHHTKKMCE